MRPAIVVKHLDVFDRSRITACRKVVKHAPLLAFALLLTGLIFTAAAPAAPAAPVPSPQTAGSGFRPLDLWTEAVLGGDQIGLKRFYSTDPQAYAQTPQGKTTDIGDEESNFWSALRSHGLASLNPKILAQTAPQPGAVQLVLRIEMTFRANGKTQRTLVNATQLWIRPGNDWVIAVAQRSDVGAMPVITLPQPTVPNTHLYADPREGPSEIQSAIAMAKMDHKRVLVIFGANWCYDCHVLDATLRSKTVAPLVEANYHVVHVSIGDGDSNADLADRYQVPLKKGIPNLAVLDGSGKLITSQKQGEFESAAKIGMADVLGFLNRWKPRGEN
jgi:thioredoxin 1